MAETFPFGAKTPVFKVAGKTFAPSQLAGHPRRVSLKCEPQLAQLRATFSAVIPGYHLGVMHRQISIHPVARETEWLE